VGSVADPECLSQVPDPNFYPSRISDPTKATKEDWEKICCHTFFVAKNFTKLKIIYFRTGREKKLPIYLELWYFISKKNIRDPEKTCSGSRIQGSKKKALDPGSATLAVGQIYFKSSRDCPASE
jgi:hypothetical protein